MGEQNKFSGLVVCADCGAAMVLHRAQSMNPMQTNFTCRTCKRFGKEVCTSHYIRECVLEEIEGITDVDLVFKHICDRVAAPVAWFVQRKPAMFTAELLIRIHRWTEDLFLLQPFCDLCRAAARRTKGENIPDDRRSMVECRYPVAADFAGSCVWQT